MPGRDDWPAGTEHPLASVRIRARVLSRCLDYGPNDNISSCVGEGDLEGVEAEVETIIARLMDALVVNRKSPHCEKTPARVARMLVREVLQGRYEGPPALTAFPNSRLDELYVVGPVSVRSCCAHHLVPIIGQCWLGVIPNGKVLGLSKFSRLVQWCAARGQIQEELTMQIADELDALLDPRGIAVVMRAAHMCCQWRGVKDANQLMMTSVTRGLFREDARARAELMALVERTAP